MALVRALFVILLLSIIGFAAYSYLSPASAAHSSAHGPVTGNPVTLPPVDTAVARERGAEVGEKVAVAAEKMKGAAEEGAITSKIKAKMVLDDTITARTIDVTTHGTTVTLTGTVRTAAERVRAESLARETDGVSAVNDQLIVGR
jgi:hyperosmotically inducible protein